MTFAVEPGVFRTMVPITLDAFVPQQVPSKTSILYIHPYGYSNSNKQHEYGRCPLILVLHVFSILTINGSVILYERLFYPEVERSGTAMRGNQLANRFRAVKNASENKAEKIHIQSCHCVSYPYAKTDFRSLIARRTPPLNEFFISFLYVSCRKR